MNEETVITAATSYGPGSLHFTVYGLLLSVLPIFLVLTAGPSSVASTSVAYEFAVHRMNHYTLGGRMYGCRNSLLNLEARVATQLGGSFARKSVLIRLDDLLGDATKFSDILQQPITGGIVILLPEDPKRPNRTSLAGLSRKQIETLWEVEDILEQEELYVPVYFTHETAELSAIYDDLHASAIHSNQWDEFKQSVIGNGYLMSVTAPVASLLKENTITSLAGTLLGKGQDEVLPTIVLAAHYDSFSVVPTLSYGANSNAIGVAAILELSRVLGKLYADETLRPATNVAFLLSGGGRFSFLGTRKWIDAQFESSDANLLTDTVFALCLDSLGVGISAEAGSDVSPADRLYVHVAKPPKETSAAGRFIADLNDFAAAEPLKSGPTSGQRRAFALIHKKINLNDDRLSWEHERFSMRRMSAMTLSGLPHPKDPARSSLADEPSRISVVDVSRDLSLIVKALLMQLLPPNVPVNKVFKDFDLQPSAKNLANHLALLTAQPRAQQLLLTAASRVRNTRTGRPEDKFVIPPLLTSLEKLLAANLAQLPGSQVQRVHLNIEPIPPNRGGLGGQPQQPASGPNEEIIFHAPFATAMTAYNVKPAVFDLLLLITILGYLAVFYVILQIFPWLRRKFLSVRRKGSDQNGLGGGDGGQYETSNGKSSSGGNGGGKKGGAKNSVNGKSKRN